MPDRIPPRVKRIGRGPLRFSPEWLLISLLLTAAILFALHGRVLWRLDQVVYDLHLKLWSRPPSPDLVIVAIDTESLSQLGRWPWKRSRHADLIDTLTAAGARAIFMDILFVEADRESPDDDRRLAQAVADSGRVFLPVIIETLNGRLVETLPLPGLVEHAAGLGHVDIDLDPDGIARRVYLREGVGSAHWPSIGVAILEKLEPETVAQLPGLRNPSPSAAGAGVIVRDNHILLPFAGAPGHFPRVSYSDVLRGRVPADQFRNKIVLVGATAPGLGDLLPTPLSGYNRPMSGVEINANLIDALRQGIVIQSLATPAQIWLSGLVLVLTFLAFPLIKPGRALPMVGVLLLATVLASGLLLHWAQLWFPPTAILLGLLLGFPLWSWRRLVHNVHYFEQELERLREEPQVFSVSNAPMGISDGLEFQRKMLPLSGWTLFDADGEVMAQGGEALSRPAPRSPSPLGQFTCDDVSWIVIPRGDTQWLLGVSDGGQGVLGGRSLQLLSDYVMQYALTFRRERRGNLERVERQVRRVQSAIADLRSMRRLLSDILRQMVDGLIVIDLGGRIVLANEQAARFVGLESDRDLPGRDILRLAEGLEVRGDITPVDIFKQVLLEEGATSFEGRTRQGGEVLVQVSPLSAVDAHFSGAIIILSDITLLKESERQRSQTLNFLSHDLRSPLTSMISMLEIQRAGVTDYSRDELSERIEGYARKALALADDFLRLARAEAIDSSGFSEVDLASLAHNALDGVYAEAREKSITLVRRFGPETAWIRGDAGLLERALINLLENAIRYSPPGSEVVLRLDCSGGVVNCRVIDQGQGIAPRDQEVIFAPFRQIRSGPIKGEKGTGLGLAFVQVVARKHRGSITVQSQVDAGTEFCLTLPFDDESGSRTEEGGESQ
ncbi:MAG: CHASE2 domain-containing protein [Sedimenticola sp.]|nr:CHASE2 domain-containing protein [Sedimenticola sp.]